MLRPLPPRYEAQAAYLKRNGLLLRGEEARLGPADFEPEEVVPANTCRTIH